MPLRDVSRCDGGGTSKAAADAERAHAQRGWLLERLPLRRVQGGARFADPPRARGGQAVSTGRSSRSKGIKGERESADIFRRYGFEGVRLQNNVLDAGDFTAPIWHSTAPG